MPTLYELLEALPEDDADGLRRAFRKAAKANHPDNNPGDPAAAQRFRRLARAHAILQDEAQRATYDASLAKARRQRAKRTIFSEFRGLLPHALSSMVIALVSIAVFLLFQNFSRMRIAATQVEEISARAPSLAAAMPAQPSDAIGRAVEHNKLDDIPVSKEPDASAAVREPAAPIVVAAAGDPGAVPAPSDVGAKDARYYRERGGLAYRSGDLSLALIDFDLAINLDPNFADGYIDRAIVFRRMGDLKRAFADVAEAKRIDDQKPR